MGSATAFLGAFVKKNVSLGRFNLTTGSPCSKLKPKIDLFVPFGRTARLSKNKGVGFFLHAGYYNMYISIKSLE